MTILSHKTPVPVAGHLGPKRKTGESGRGRELHDDALLQNPYVADESAQVTDDCDHADEKQSGESTRQLPWWDQFVHASRERGHGRVAKPRARASERQGRCVDATI